VVWVCVCVCLSLSLSIAHSSLFSLANDDNFKCGEFSLDSSLAAAAAAMGNATLSLGVWSAIDARGGTDTRTSLAKRVR